MNSHDVAVLGYLLVAVAMIVLQGLSMRKDARIPSLGSVFSRVMRTRSGRVGVMAGWAWLGLHFFAR
jgi:Family of unknown function (DUF6186)